MNREQEIEQKYLEVYFSAVYAILPLLMTIAFKMVEPGNLPMILFCISMGILFVHGYFFINWLNKKPDPIYGIITFANGLLCLWLYYGPVPYPICGVAVFIISTICFVYMIWFKTKKRTDEINRMLKEKNERN